MEIKVDLTSHEPIYTQIIEQIRQMIDHGLLKPGDQLPTVRQLASDLRVNFNTVARAYRLLDEAGIISTQHGRGTFIRQPLSDDISQENLMQRRKNGLMKLIEQFLLEAKQYGFTTEELKTTVLQQIDLLVAAETETKSSQHK